ncbi:MAG: hypothetical protein WKF92_15770 [Pyrinomonadaceae bacterium]
MSENLRVKELLGKHRLLEPERIEEAEGSLYTIVPNGDKDTPVDLPEYVLSIDGSFVEVPVTNGVFSAGIAYVTITDVLLLLKELRQIDEDRPADPRKVRNTTSAGAVDTVLAGCNIIFEGEIDPQSSFRRGIIDLFSEQCSFEGGETLLDSYEALLAYKPAVPLQRCPYGDTCAHKTPRWAFKRISGTEPCECPRGLSVHSTDAMRIYEKFNPIGENTAAFGETIHVTERLWLIHILRSLEQQGMLGLLAKMAIVLDGPLAVFGSPGWLSRAISRELFRINEKVQAETGNDLLLIGIEKSGLFVDHLSGLCSRSDAGTGRIKISSQTALLPTDEYIRKFVVFTTNTHQYGDVTYFGRKLFYRTRTGAQIVATLPFLKADDRDLDTALAGQFPRLADALNLFDALGSSRYPNALIPITLAHGEAAIPARLGKRVLETLSGELISAAKVLP